MSLVDKTLHYGKIKISQLQGFRHQYHSQPKLCTLSYSTTITKNIQLNLILPTCLSFDHTYKTSFNYLDEISVSDKIVVIILKFNLHMYICLTVTNNADHVYLTNSCSQGICQ